VTEAVIGLDVGTSVAKAVLFDLAGTELAVAARAYPLHTPQPGWAELDPEQIWDAVAGALRDLTAAPAPGTRIRALALACQGGTLLPSGADGTPTYPAITWLDGRSQDLAAQWRAEGVAERVRRTSGWPPEPGLPLLSIAWLRQARPDAFAATERFLSVNDYVAQRLTGRATTNPSMAGEMLLANVATGRWSVALCDLAGIHPGQLSPIVPSEAPIGTVQPAAGCATGLGADVVVINGGQDHACEALALGLTSAGTGLLACGTAWVVNAITTSPAVDGIPPGMALNSHVVPDHWVASQFLGGLGACLEWWLGQCGPRSAGPDWAAFDAALAGTAPGSGGLLYLPQAGALDAPGAGGFYGLRLDHTWADLGRAIMEAAACELRWALADLRQAGLAIEEVWMVGGAAHSPLWPHIVADAGGLPVLLSPYSHGPALGAAILATAGLGIYPSVEAARARFRAPARRLAPDGTHAPAYDRQYAAYRRLALGGTL
jgi:sugar (pentulose or hexulose) kinase